MAKFFGAIGYATWMKSAPGVSTMEIVERECTGDLIRNSRKLQDGEGLNDDISLGNSVSVVADAFLTQNITAIRYIKWNGGYWKVTSVEVQAPRITLRMGEVYNGDKASAPSTP